MARARGASLDEELLFNRQVSPLDGCLSSSWPVAPVIPSRRGPEPPRAPLRKPSGVDWEVPPLQLPPGSGQRKCCRSGASSATRSPASGPADRRCSSVGTGEDEDDEEMEDKDEDACIFMLERCRLGSWSLDGEDTSTGNFDMKLVGFDDACDVNMGEANLVLAAPVESPRGGLLAGAAALAPPPPRSGASPRGASPPPSLGASPMLLSALELAAAAAEGDAAAGRGLVGR